MRGRPIQYSPDELAFVRENCTLPGRELHREFCQRFGREDVSATNLAALRKRNGWLTGRTGRFEPGQAAHNKGKTMSAETRAKVQRTWFRKGGRPHTYRGPGHESIDPKDGYVWLIVAETNPHTGAPTRRVLKHHWLWEQANGPVPEGHALKCLDGDRQNTDPGNWIAIPRALLPRLAGGRHGQYLKYDDAPPELRKTLLAIAHLEDAARKRRRGKEEES